MTLDELVGALGATVDGTAAVVPLPLNWTQGRTAYGGITAALGLAAVRLLIPDLPPLRSAQVAFVGPLAGELSFRPHLLRQGRSASFVRVDALAGDAIGATMTFVFAQERVSDIARAAVAEPFETGETFLVPAPVLFAQNFDYWFAAGANSLVDRVLRMKAPSSLDPGADPGLGRHVAPVEAAGHRPAPDILLAIVPAHGLAEMDRSIGLVLPAVGRDMKATQESPGRTARQTPAFGSPREEGLGPEGAASRGEFAVQWSRPVGRPGNGVRRDPIPARLVAPCRRMSRGDGVCPSTPRRVVEDDQGCFLPERDFASSGIDFGNFDPGQREGPVGPRLVRGKARARD